MTTTFLLLSLLPAAAWITTVAVAGRHGRRRGAHLPYFSFALTTVVAHGLAHGLGAEGWGHVHLAYLVLTVSIPLCAAAGLTAELARRRRRARPAVVALGVVGLVPAAIGFYATHVEPSRLSVERAALDVGGLSGDEVRVAVYSDPQMAGLGDHETEALARLVAEQPHVLLVPGDLFSAPFDVVRADVQAFRGLLRSVDAPVLMVTGDHDQHRTLTWLARGTDVTVLDGEVAVLDAGAARVAVAGIGHGTDHDDARAVLDRLAATAADVRLVLSHEPETIATVAGRDRVDLVVAGDTHGGQVRLPLVGLLHNPSDVPDDVAAGGLHRVGGVDVYVSRGVGVLRGQAPQIRLGAPPAVDLITLC